MSKYSQLYLVKYATIGVKPLLVEACSVIDAVERANAFYKNEHYIISHVSVFSPYDESGAQIDYYLVTKNS